MPSIEIAASENTKTAFAVWMPFAKFNIGFADVSQTAKAVFVFSEAAISIDGTNSAASSYFRFGCGVVRRYGLTSLKPLGKSVLASSLLTEETMMQSSPCFQSDGVATL